MPFSLRRSNMHYAFVYPTQLLGMALIVSSCGDTKSDASAMLTTSSAGATTSTVAQSSNAPSTATSVAVVNPPIAYSSSALSTSPSSSVTPTAQSAVLTGTPPGATASTQTPPSASSSVAPEPSSTPPDGGGVEPEPSEPAPAAEPSPGCVGGNSNAMVPSAVVDKPSAYDGSTPVPVLFAFHGAGGNESSLQGPFASDAKARGYLGVYLKSTGNGWDVRADTPVLDAALDAIAQNYCVDLNRVFAVGHSSGAQMITQLLCAGEDRFRAVAPVASSKYCNGWDATPAIVIHGVDDIERGGQGEMRYGLNDGDGHIDFGVYHDSNECTDSSTPFDPGGNCGASIDPGCVEYDTCAARTVFCNHNDPQYGTSNHGVPCFASNVMFDFFDDFE